MGKGIIVENKGRAYYRIKFVKDEGNAESRIAAIQQLLINYQSILNNLVIECERLYLEEFSLFSDYCSISLSYDGSIDSYAEIIEAKKLYSLKCNERQENLAEQSYLKMQMASLTKEKETLERAIADEEMNVWCVDYTDNLHSGDEVGTIELDGDFRWINIMAGGKTTDAIGMMQPCACSTPSGTFRNLSLMPCWQKWKPTYRAGTILEIDYKNGRCDVVLDSPNESSATAICRGRTLSGKYRSVSINQFTEEEERSETGEIIRAGETVLRNIPINYMNGSYEAFIEGDHVIVAFPDRSWINPVVIGFHDNPRPATDIIRVSFYDVILNDNFYSELDVMISVIDDLIGHANYLIGTYAPMIIDLLPSLEGLPREIYYVAGIPLEYEWTSADIAPLTYYWNEMIGLPTPWDVEGRSKESREEKRRRYFRQNAVEYRDSLLESKNVFNTMKTLQPYIAEYTTATLTGHTYAEYETVAKPLDGAVLNFEIKRIDKELESITSPDGTSEWERSRNQSIAAEEIWASYASAELSCSIYLETGNIVYTTESGVQVRYKAGDKVQVRKASGQEAYFPQELTDYGIYTIFSITQSGVMELADYEGNQITTFTVQGGGSDYGYFTCRGIDKAAILKLQVESNYAGYKICSMEAECISVVDAGGEFIIICRNPHFESDVVELASSTRFTMYLWETGKQRQALARFPMEFEYNVVHWNVSGMNPQDAITLNLAISIDAKIESKPDGFGGNYEIGAKEVKNIWGDLMTVGVADWWGDAGTFMFFWTLPKDDFTKYLSLLPTGFYWFASRYKDHPIITGRNDAAYNPGLTIQECDAIVRYVNQYVNEHYTYRKDTGDSWEFLNQARTSGDCEDFALTKIDLCLKMGVPIHLLKFAYGLPESTSNGSGHAWVVYRGQHVLDISSNDFLTVDDMIAKGYVRLGGQVQGNVSGLRWYYNDTRDTTLNQTTNEIFEFPASVLWMFYRHTADILMANVSLIKT